MRADRAVAPLSGGLKRPPYSPDGYSPIHKATFTDTLQIPVPYTLPVTP